MPRNKKGNRTKGQEPPRQSRPYPYPHPNYQHYPMPPYNPYQMFGGMMPTPMAHGLQMMYPPYMPAMPAMPAMPTMPMPYPYSVPTPSPTSALQSHEGGLAVPSVPLQPPVAPPVVAPVPLEPPVAATSATSAVEPPVEVPDEDWELKDTSDANDDDDDEETVVVEGKSSNCSGIYLPGVNTPDDLDVFVPDAQEKSQEGKGRKKGALNSATKSRLLSSATQWVKEQSKSGQSKVKTRSCASAKPKQSTQQKLLPKQTAQPRQKKSATLKNIDIRQQFSDSENEDGDLQ